MKKFIVTLALLTTSLAFADIKITKLRFSGKAMKLKDGTVQIINPLVAIGGKKYNIAFGEGTYSYPETPKAICASIGMDYVDHAPGDSVVADLVSVEGGLHFFEDLPIGSVTCE